MGRVPGIVKNILLAVLASVVFLLLLEVVLRLTEPLYDNYYTMTWQYSRELKLVVSDEPFLFDHRGSKSVRVYNTEIALNSEGLRDREFPLEKPTDRIRIAAVGDSTTLGWGVSLEESYPKVLERLLNNGSQEIEVLNFGVGNYNTFQEYHKIQRDVLKYDPDLIILQFYINDPEGIENPAFYWLRQHSYVYMFLWERMAGAKNRLGQYDGKEYYRALYTEQNRYRTQNRESLEGIAALCKENNITLYIMFIPELQTFDGELARLQAGFVTDVVEENMLLDLTSDFCSYNPGQLHISEEDIHLNAQGHRIIAEGLYTWLKGII